MKCLNSLCLISTLQICVKQVVWSSGILGNCIWATCIVIYILGRVQRGKKLVSSDQKLVAKKRLIDLSIVQYTGV